jgi:hypothetical protein
VLSCKNGHAMSGFSKCETCGQPVDLERSLSALVELPAFQVSWESTTILTVGLPSLNRGEACNLKIQDGEKAQESENTFTYEAISGETWHDVLVKNEIRFEKWISNTGFYHAKYKYVIVDTTDPVAVLVTLTLRGVENLVIFAVSADETSNSLEQNTSYVALSFIKKKKLPVIAVSKSYLEKLPFFIEDVELTVNTDSFSELLSFFASSISELVDVVNRDLKFGVWSHALSAVLSASDLVYTKPDVAIALQQKHALAEIPFNDTQTACLFGRADKSQHEGLVNAFKKQFDDGNYRLVNKDIRLFEKRTNYKLYDLLLLLGIKDLNFKNIERGYQLVASKNPDLGVKD